MSFDPIFKRHSPLPAEVRKTYKADRTLRPSDVDSTLPIKFWEIEVSDDPQEKWWAGCIHVRSEAIKRPIVEGTDLEMTIKIDASRKLTVDLFIPLLNQSFSQDVYIPDPPNSRSQLQQQLDTCFERLNYIRAEIYESDRADIAPRFEQLQHRCEWIAEQVSEGQSRGDQDPDSTLAPTEALRKLRIGLTQLEEQLEISGAIPTKARKMRWILSHVERIVMEHGTESDHREFKKLEGQYHRYSESNDVRGLKWVESQLWELRWPIVKDQHWFWQGRLSVLRSPGRRFLNHEQAMKHLTEAEGADARGDLIGLRSAVDRAWSLIPPEQIETAREQESQSGLRST